MTVGDVGPIPEFPSEWGKVTFVREEDTAHAARLFEADRFDFVLCSGDKPWEDFFRWIRAIDEDSRSIFVLVGRARSNTHKPDLVIEKGFSFDSVDSLLRLKIKENSLKQSNTRLLSDSLTDELTKLSNMRGFRERFQVDVEANRKSSTGLCVIMLDLDHFKAINDSHNHLVGSALLAQVGKLLFTVGEQRKNSLLARYGGDEFVMLFSVQNFEEAGALGEEIRAKIATNNFVWNDVTVSITSSIGIAYIDPGVSVEPLDFLRASDLMLYFSKEEGRNRVSLVNLNNDIGGIIAKLESKLSEKRKAQLAAKESNLTKTADKAS
jgi:diguanylate cyclase (GGDEF)-like protein